MITRTSRVRVLSRLALPAALLAGCITVYQPMTGLHRPIAIDTRVANFKDVAVNIQCVPAKFVGASDMAKLCRRVARLFENQGARVEARVSKGRTISEDPIEPTAPDGRIVLDVELRSRRVHAQTAAPFWWDDEADITFAQDIVIRDETGFLLMRDTISGRFVRRLGWSSDAEAEFSRDYYGQLSQLAFNARMRWAVAGGGRGRVDVKPPAVAPGSAASDAPAAADDEGMPGGAPPVTLSPFGGTLKAEPAAPASTGGAP